MRRLRQVVMICALLAAAPAATTGTACPDVDNDGLISGIDVLRVHVALGTSAADLRYNPAADVDNSGFVDGTDLALVAIAFGTSCN